MKLLVYSSLFPNAAQPHHGIFVLERLRHYLAAHGGEATVVAPTPWAPPLIGPAHWRAYRAVPRAEAVAGLSVVHPRYPSPPGFGDDWRGGLMAAGTRAAMLREAARCQPTVLDAHYAYPDGVAAARLRPVLERRLGRPLPLVITCRGTDLNLSASQAGVREQIAAALNNADHVVCVAEALRTVALELGVPPEHVTTLRNGVDLERFVPADRQAVRQRLGLPLDRRVFVCIGHLVERKGQHLLVEAFARAFGPGPAGPELVFVGQGELRDRLVALAARHGVSERVRLVGAVPPADLPPWHQAADALVLASSREGWPNVVLEALASGTPVVATRVWGTPEVLTGCAAGCLVEPTVAGLAAGLLAAEELDPSAARPWAERHTWTETVDGLHAVFEAVVASRSHAA